MKILVVGDFHGKLPLSLKRIIQKEKVDLILSPGDYCGDERVSKLFFKYVYGKDESEVSKDILKRIKKYEREGVEAGFNVIKELKKLKKPFFGVRGNWDPLDYRTDIWGGKWKKEKHSQRLLNTQKKGFSLIDFKNAYLKEFTIVGGVSSTHHGKIDKKTLKQHDKALINGRVREYNRRKRNYEKLFTLAKKKKKPIIFLTHNCPYETKLDKVKTGPAKGKHYGSYLEKQMIRRFKPDLVICGHMHENPGRDKIGNSIIMNAGAFMDKRYAVVDFGKKMKIMFFK